MDAEQESSRPARGQVIGAIALIAVVVAVVLGIYWIQDIDEQNERAECEQSGLVQDGTWSVEDCML
ncbi:hypothetical protein [Promicromonospora sp. NFX87]|uniref:hypothetical protein n=1 Tax=Promicromonospora sp. NFX87 TaxID=3402691 RepID=UPI003AFA1333